MVVGRLINSRATSPFGPGRSSAGPRMLWARPRRGRGRGITRGGSGAVLEDPVGLLPVGARRPYCAWMSDRRLPATGRGPPRSVLFSSRSERRCWHPSSKASVVAAQHACSLLHECRRRLPGARRRRRIADGVCKGHWRRALAGRSRIRSRVGHGTCPESPPRQAVRNSTRCVFSIGRMSVQPWADPPGSAGPCSLAGDPHGIPASSPVNAAGQHDRATSRT